MDQNRAGSAVTSEISKQVWAGWLYRSRSTDGFLYNHSVGKSLLNQNIQISTNSYRIQKAQWEQSPIHLECMDLLAALDSEYLDINAITICGMFTA